MADIKDVSAVITSALEEVNLSGTLGIEMDGGEVVSSVGSIRGDDVKVVVTVRRVGEDA